MAQLRCKVLAEGEPTDGYARIQFRKTQRSIQVKSVVLNCLRVDARGSYIEVELIGFPAKNRLLIQLPDYYVYQIYDKDLTYSEAEAARAARRDEERRIARAREYWESHRGRSRRSRPRRARSAA